MSTAHVTYSTPRVTRSATEAIIDFDIVTPDRTAWDTIRLNRGEDGTITMLDRGTAVGLANVTIPRPIVPVVLAEIERLADGGEVAPFAPVAAVQLVTAEQVALGGVA